MGLGLTVLRVAVGGGFAAHGAQKLFGWFGGPGLDATAKGFEEGLQMAPGKPNAVAAGAAELGGGLALVAGVATPLATTALTSTMVTAIWKVHKANGFFATEGGWEYNAVLIAALAVLADEGPGALALGHGEAGGLKAAAFTLVAGAAGAFAAMELGRRQAGSGDTGAPAAAAA